MSRFKVQTLMPNKGTTNHENEHPHPFPPPSGDCEGGGWFYFRVK